MLTSGDPYTIPQAGFNHAWNTHGGGAYLHEHLVDDYVSCWQQGLPNGETDASVCDHGTSRWFNYYLEGKFSTSVTVVVAAAPMRVPVFCINANLRFGAPLSAKVPSGRSIKHHTWTECELSNHCAEINATRQHRAPRMDVKDVANCACSYYDGINFDRRGMRRVRKVLDRASEGKKFAPLIDIHTGNIGPDSPSAVTYLSHFPYADSAWNGEGSPAIMLSVQLSSPRGTHD